MSTQQGAAITEVKVIDLKEIEGLLAQPGAESIITPEVKKPNIFTAKPNELEFIDKPETEGKTPEELEAEKAANKPDVAAEGANILDNAINADDELETEEADEADKNAKPGITKEALVTVTNKLIEKGLIIPFGGDDEKPIEKYTVTEFEELLEVNFADREKKLREEIPLEFFDALPEELQYAYKYVADGGTNLKTLFKVLAQSEEVKELDPATESGQAQIVRSYLTATSFGTPEDIEEEVSSWKDRGELEAKANKFKPKLDAMQEQLIAKQLQDQEKMRKQSQQQQKAYMENIYNVLQPAELSGIKLDKKTQSMLYAGLVQANYPSVSGKQTNLFGHLLEKYQFVEPNHGLIAEALWLLADPEGYKNKVRDGARKETTEKTVKLLKTEQANKTSSSGTNNDDTENNSRSSKRTGLARPTVGFFKR